MNFTPEMAEKINSAMSCLQSHDKTMILGLVDIVDQWPFGKTYLASTTAEEVFIQFKGFRQSKIMLWNLKDALSGLTENVTVKTAVIKCNHIDVDQATQPPIHEINLVADINSSYSEIVQLLIKIEEITDNNLYYFESKLQSKDLKNKIFSGYVEYATKKENEEKITVHHRSFLLE